MESRHEHVFVQGVMGRSKKYRPNSHCHGYVLKSRYLHNDVIVKSIYDEEHLKNVCYIVLRINNTHETIQELPNILDKISDIQQVIFNDSGEFKTTTVIDLDALRTEKRLPEIDHLRYDKSYRFNGYADFMTVNEIWMEAMRYF